MKNIINIENEQDERSLFRGYKSALKSAVNFVLKKESMPASSVDISLTALEEIRRLNREYRDKDKATDVLSFPLIDSFDDIEESDKENGRLLLGDIIICPEYIYHQAKDFDNSYKNEMILMCIHSALHLLGYDHIKKKDRDIMFPKQEAYYKEFTEMITEKNNG